MKEKKPLSLVLRGFFFIVLIDLVVIAVVTGIGWWTGWTELDNFQKAIQWAGILVLGFGLLGLIGNLRLPGGRDEQSSRSGSGMEKGQAKLPLLGVAQRYSFTLIMFVAGMVCLLIGWMM
jgi:hypothetical protein